MHKYNANDDVMKNNRKRFRELIKVIFASHFMVIDSKNQVTGY